MLADRLVGARRYDRIAGYFRSSLLDVVGDALEGVGQVRVVCNGELDAADVTVAKAARDGAAAVSRALVARWQTGEDGLDALLSRDRYQRLHALLASGQMRVRVVAQGGGNVFLHGKAGVIEAADGERVAFIGSANDSVSGWRHAYELMWLDADPSAADWVQAEFDHFWDMGVDLPDAVVAHIGAQASRTEYASIDAARAEGAAAAAALAERPLYRAGQILRPWQKRFVETCIEDRRLHGSARYLLADDVGLGKTLSMAAAALVLALQADGPVLILAPATLTWQWQTELRDLLGIPAAVWSSTGKQWVDHERRALTPRGEVNYVARCPWRFGIVSTGLIINGRAGERAALEAMRPAVIVLDEAHKARAIRIGPDGVREGENNLLAFMQHAAARSQNVLLGTATPIQLWTEELWDLIYLLHQGASHVLGAGATEWARSDGCIDYLSGARPWPRDSTSRWDLMKSPLPASGEDAIFRDIRAGAGLADRETRGPRFETLDRDLARDFDRDFERLATEHNPLIRRIVRRTRPMLEERGLLKRIHVEVHPTAADRLPERLFTGEGLAMGVAFTEAYQAAEAFCRLYAQTRPAAGFLKTILLRRIGSSPAAGLATARYLLRGDSTDVLEAEQGDIEPEPEAGLSGLNSGERSLLERVIVNLEAVSEMPDPKIDVAVAYLRDRDWLTSHGAILFSQYLTTAEWTADALAAAFPNEPVGVYAGGAASFVLRGTERRGARREDIKAAVQSGELRLLAATDAACEGLNLQSLGAQFNMDLPWNPSRLEQRKGRVQRIGQARDIVHIVNMRYAGTVEDDVYAALSHRMGDIFAVIGQLPEGFEDDWVGAVLRDRAAVRNFPSRAGVNRPPMEMRYARHVADDDGLDWEYAARVIAERDLDDFLRTPW